MTADPAGPGAAGSGDSSDAQLHAPFRPVRSRQVATALGVVQAVVLAGIAVLLPASGAVVFHWYDRFGVLLVAAAIGWLLFRYARIALLPRRDGFTVRNLLVSRELTWAQVVAVEFADGAPWVTLDLADGDTLPVLAIQRADGRDTSMAQARRLATLVALHSRTPRDD